MYERKYRPQRFSEFFGNEAVIELLKKKLRDKVRFPHALMFQGQSGCGKTTLARIVAKKLGANAMAISELNAANVRGIDTIRAVVEEAEFGHVFGGIRVYILDEAHQLTLESQNALLKAIEDSPEYVYYMLCTTEPDRVIETVKNRCVRFELRPLTVKESFEFINYIIEREHLDYDEEVKKLIVRSSGGIPRSLAIYLYECEGLSVSRAKELLSGSVDGVTAEIVDVCKMLLEPRRLKWSALMERVRDLSSKDSPEKLRRKMFAYFASVLRSAKSMDRVFYYTAILNELDSRVEDNAQGINGLVFLLGKIVTGLSLGER